MKIVNGRKLEKTIKPDKANLKSSDGEVKPGAGATGGLLETYVHYIENGNTATRY